MNVQALLVLFMIFIIYVLLKHNKFVICEHFSKNGSASSLHNLFPEHFMWKNSFLSFLQKHRQNLSHKDQCIES